MDDRRLPRDSLERYSGVNPADISKTPETPVVPVTESPEQKPARMPWYNPRGWPLWMQVLCPCLLLATIGGIIAGVVVGVKDNRYPKYTPLTYHLQDAYAGPSFFEQFTYFTEEDPTDGFVVYVSRETATNFNLTYATDTSAILRVDSFTPNTLGGRNSVRVESKKAYDTGLFIFDIIHTPYGCGTWPALWMTDGANWPSNGEIDILETTNEGSNGNAVTLHTTPGCKMNVKRKETGEAVYTTCDNSTNGNSGCGVLGGSETYGAEFNENGGGIYALEIRNEGIRTWFFPRKSIPQDIIESTGPDPSTWGTALADFPSTNCDIPSHFRNQNIVVNIDLCGELAAMPMYYHEMYHCPSTCTDFVAQNPEAFREAFWEFGSFKVYQAV